jgi:hypothetical protein
MVYNPPSVYVIHCVQSLTIIKPYVFESISFTCIHKVKKNIKTKKLSKKQII